MKTSNSFCFHFLLVLCLFAQRAIDGCAPKIRTNFNATGILGGIGSSSGSGGGSGTTTTTTSTSPTSSSPSTPNPNCGMPGVNPSINGATLNLAIPSGRIINGDVAVQNSWPWTVQIYTFQTPSSLGFICGGALIDINFILTTASCIEKYPPGQLLIGVGQNNLTQSTTGLYGVISFNIHVNYTADRSRNNIAVVRLNRTVPLSSTVNTICLPTNFVSTLIYNQYVVSTGWGSTNGSNIYTVYSTMLKQIILGVYNQNDTCLSYSLTSVNYCTLNITVSPGNMCFGDEGSPLIYFTNNAWYLFGLLNSYVSFNGICAPSLPSFFVKVPNFSGWIYSQIYALG